MTTARDLVSHKYGITGNFMLWVLKLLADTDDLLRYYNLLRK